MPKVLVFNGSPRAKGNCSLLSESILQSLKERGVSFNYIHPKSNISGCIHCKEDCFSSCNIKDELYPIYADNSFESLLVLTPSYFFNVTPQTKAFLDRFNLSSLDNKNFGFILTSSAEGITSGKDLILEYILRYVSTFNDCRFLGFYHKITNDTVGEVNSGDKKNLNRILNKL